jgi:hypothetical protein
VFVNGRLLHDNFRFVHASTRLLHARRMLSLLLKVNIAHAFDFITWPFLLEVLEHLGFPPGWRDWVATLLSTVSTQVLMNGGSGKRICHTHGLHQGDPLSPMMFILTMEVLSAIIHCADDWALLEDLKIRAIPYRISLYANDLVLFVRPNAQDLQLMRSVFSMFGGASSLGCNLAKCQLTLIRCDQGQI